MAADVRWARVVDVPLIHELLDEYAGRGLLVPRTLHSIYRDVRGFCVGEVAGQPCGCGLLQIVGPEKGEIHCVAVMEYYQRRGVGRSVVEFLLEDAWQWGLRSVVCLTQAPEFFERLGFVRCGGKAMLNGKRLCKMLREIYGAY